MRFHRQPAGNIRASFRWLCRIGIVAGLVLNAAQVRAEDVYPSRPIRIIVPFAPGGPSDAAARIAAQALTDHVHEKVYVENLSGGGGVIGAEAVAKAPADGYTLLLSDGASFTVTPMMHKVSYDPDHDFVGVGQVAAAPQALVVNPKSPFKSVRELVDFAKTNPHKVTFGSAGLGTTTHLSILLLQKAASISLVHVPYRSTGLSVADVLKGDTNAIFGDVSTLAPLVQSEQLVALATTGDKRSPLLPDVPTMGELGYPSVLIVNWFGLHVRSQTPADTLQRLKAAVLAMQKDPAFLANLKKRLMFPGTVGADAFNKMVQDTADRLAPLVRALGPIE
jgi:tripartite-type tricarboxylate transporter receptor subunit TctC